jgi:hypothetical protein
MIYDSAQPFIVLAYEPHPLQWLSPNYYQTACMAATAGRQVKRMREAFFCALLRQSISYFDANDQGEI